MSEARTFRSSLKWAMVMSWGQRGIALGFTVALAAILGPDDFGIVAMAIVFIQLIEVFLEQGIATAIIQRKELEPEHLDSAFWLNLGWGLVLAGVGVATSGLWADATSTPELAPVIQVLSATLVLLALSVVQQAVLRRELEFKKLAMRANTASFAGGIAGISLALTGAGIWSLVGQQLVLEVVSLVLLWSVASWTPRFRFSWRHAKDLLGFSLDVFAANLGGFLGRRADALLIGVFFGPAVVGVYRLADRIVDTVLELTMRPVGLISLPHFSRLQDDRPTLRRTVERCVTVALYASVPALLVLAACSGQVLAVIGDEWTIGSTALKFLAVVGIVKAFVFFAGPLLFAVARPRLRAAVLWLLAAYSTVVVAVVGIAFRDATESGQLLGMSATRALAFIVVSLPVNLLIVTRVSGLPMRAILSRLPAPIASGASALCVSALLDASGAIHGMSPIPALIVVGSATSVSAAITFLALERSVRAEVFRFGRKAVNRRSEPEAQLP